MIEGFSESESSAILSWMGTFKFNEDFREAGSVKLTYESLSDGIPILRILKDAEPIYFDYLDLDATSENNGKKDNLQKIAGSIDSMLLQSGMLWTGPEKQITHLELILRQTIGVALKSQRSEIYIEQLMELDEEAQQNLSALVQSSLAQIYEGDSSRSSISFTSDSGVELASPKNAGLLNISIDQRKSGHRSSLGDDLQIGSLSMAFDERRMRELQRSALIAERESRQFQEENLVIKRDIALLRTENEQLKAHLSELDSTTNDQQSLMDKELNKQQLKTQMEIAAHADQNRFELGEREKKIGALKNEKALMQRQHEDRLGRLQSELEEFKEQAGQLKKNETLLDVYKKKLDTLGDVRIDLKDAQELNQKLYNDIEILQKETEKAASLENMVTKLQSELGKVKHQCDQKDLSIQEVNFQLRDAESRVKDLEQKEAFYKTQIDKLTAEVTTAEEELMLMKRETDSTARADTDKAEVKDKLNLLVIENKQLQRQVEQKFSVEKFETEQELQDARGKLTITEAKVGQLEKRIEKLEERLAEAKETQIQEAAKYGQAAKGGNQTDVTEEARPFISDGFVPHISNSPKHRSKTMYQSTNWNSDPNQLQMTNNKTTPFPGNLSEIVTSNLNEEDEYDADGNQFLKSLHQQEEAAKIIIISAKSQRNKTFSAFENDHVGVVANANTISWLNNEGNQRTTDRPRSTINNVKCENNFDNKTIDGDYRGAINTDEIDQLQREKDALAAEVEKLKEAMAERVEELRAKESEFAEKMLAKEAWVKEQKRNQLMRMRMLTEKISSKLKLNPDQAKLLKKI